MGSIRTLPQVPTSAILSYYETALIPLPEVLSILQVCDLAGNRRHTVLGWIHAGHLRSFYIGQKYQIPKTFLIEFAGSDYYAKSGEKSPSHQLAIRFAAKDENDN